MEIKLPAKKKKKYVQKSDIRFANGDTYAEAGNAPGTFGEPGYTTAERIGGVGRWLASCESV